MRKKELRKIISYWKDRHDTLQVELRNFYNINNNLLDKNSILQNKNEVLKEQFRNLLQESKEDLQIKNEIISELHKLLEANKIPLPNIIKTNEKYNS